jgi:hypothetical protein
MAGPPSPAGSDSSVATVHEAKLSWQKEKAVLRKKDPDLDTDEWPIFLLNDATVYKKDRRTLANALEMDFEGPFVVRGRLDMDLKEQGSHCEYLRVGSTSPGGL